MMRKNQFLQIVCIHQSINVKFEEPKTLKLGLVTMAEISSWLPIPIIHDSTLPLHSYIHN